MIDWLIDVMCLVLIRMFVLLYDLIRLILDFLAELLILLYPSPDLTDLT